MNKKEFLLQQIIRAYLQHLEPIGSSQLKNMFNIDFSPATIRGYFKKLGEEGYLVQEHISSGRIPTFDALKEYWQNRIIFDFFNLDSQFLKKLAKSLGLTILIKFDNNQRLVDVRRFEDILILDFENEKVCIRQNQALARFLQDLLGLDVLNIIKFSSSVGAFELSQKLKKEFVNGGFEMLNSKPMIEMLSNYDFEENFISKFLNGEILDNLEQKLYFENLLPVGFLGACHYCSIDSRSAKMLIIGQLSTDYIYFYNNLRGA